MERLTLWPAYAPQGVAISTDTAEDALARYWGDGHGSGLASQGPDYYAPPQPPRETGEADTVGFADLPWAVLLAGQPQAEAAQSLLRKGPIDVSAIPTKRPLEAMDDDELDTIASTVWKLQKLHYVGVALAVKLLHPKRPAAVPVIDNQNFFGSYANSRWQPPKSAPSIFPRSRHQVVDALHAVRRVVADDGNERAWQQLQGWISLDGRGPLSRIELFDMIWWTLRHRPETGLSLPG